jgi:hypothetical protein
MAAEAYRISGVVVNSVKYLCPTESRPVKAQPKGSVELQPEPVEK